MLQSVFELASRREGAKKVFKEVDQMGNQVNQLKYNLDGGYRCKIFIH